MSAKYFRIIALQSVIALFVFLSFVYYFVKYDSEQLQNQVNNIGQTLTFAIQENVNISEGVLASFAYNFEIDPDLDEAKFETLAKHYLKVNPGIIYVQRKDKETTTVMVYPETYNYTLGATLIGRPEVEEAVLKAIKDKIVTANAPYVLKDTDDLIGLVIRHPLYHEETFNGFFVVVMNIDNFFKGIMDVEMTKDYNISFFDDNEKLFWGYDGPHKGHIYINNIAILDNFWTIQLSMKNNMMASTIGFVTGTSILFLLVVGLLVVMQIKLLKKDHNIQHLNRSKTELEKVKESYTLALASANEALWEWNIITGEIHTSDQWEKINGYERVGQGVDAILQKEFIHPKDYEQSVFALEACLRGEKHTFDITYRIKNPSGNYNLVQNRGKIYNDDRGFPKILAGSISNITERKQTELKLTESEALLSRSQELAHIGSWSLDLITNKLYWSDETYRIFGCEPQEFTATYEVFLEFIFPDDRAAVDEAYARSVREKSDSYVIEHRILRHSTGEIRHVYERCVHVRDDAGDIFQSIGMIHDITERKAAETEQRMLLEQAQRDRMALLSTLEDQLKAKESLRESEARFRQAIASAPFPIMIHAEDGQVLTVNTPWTQLTGYEHDDIPTIADWTRKAYGVQMDLVQADIDNLYTLDRPKAEGEYNITTSSGDSRTWDFSSAPIGKLPDGRRLVISMAVDITARIQIETERHKFFQLVESSSEFIGMCDLDMNPIYVNPAGRRMVGLPDMAAACRVKVKDYYFPEDQRFISEEFFPQVLREGYGDVEIRLRHFQTGEPIWMFYSLFNILDDHKTPVGWATVSRDITESRLAEESLKTYAEELERQRNELNKRMHQSVNAISKIGELRDVYTAGHQKRVADLAFAIGKEMGLAEEKISNLSYGGLLHDVGKFFIPSDILNKPGKLSDLEYKIIQTHVVESYNVVKEIDFSEEIYTMIYQHHERLDGSGYPQGISGDEIILESRIMAVADVVEAMSSHRPYRSALGIDAALEEIELHKGTRFDADVVDICIRLFREKKYKYDEK